jgi:hypothetical protein
MRSLSAEGRNRSWHLLCAAGQRPGIPHLRPGGIMVTPLPKPVHQATRLCTYTEISPSSNNFSQGPVSGAS